MFHSFSFKKKISALIAVSMAGLCIFTGAAFVQLRANIIEGRTDELVTAVKSARSMYADDQTVL